MPDFDFEKILKENASWATPVTPINFKGVGDALRGPGGVAQPGQKDFLERFLSSVYADIANPPISQFRGVNTVLSQPKTTGVEPTTTAPTPKTIGVPVRPWATGTSIKGIEGTGSLPTGTSGVESSIPEGATNINMTGGIQSYTTKGVDGGAIHNFIFQPAEEKGTFGRPVENTSWKGVQAGGAGDLNTGAAANNYMLGNRGVEGGPDAIMKTLKDRIIQASTGSGGDKLAAGEIEKLVRGFTSLMTAKTGVEAAKAAAKGIEQTGEYQKGTLVAEQHKIGLLEKKHGLDAGELSLRLDEMGLKKKDREDLIKNKFLDDGIKLSTFQTIDAEGNKTTNIDWTKVPAAVKAIKQYRETGEWPADFGKTGSKVATQADMDQYITKFGKDKAKAAMTKDGYTFSLVGNK